MIGLLMEKLNGQKKDVKKKLKIIPQEKKFEKGNKSAYKAALKNHWLDEFFPKSAPKIPLAS